MVKGEVFYLSAIYPREDNLEGNPLQALKAMSNPDTMYLHEAMKETDWKEFITAMVK